MDMAFHVAIIPDGNRRWAVQHSLAPEAGHDAGRKALEALMDTAGELGITHLTVWGASVDNLTRRSTAEVAYLDSAFREIFQSLASHETIRQQGIRVSVIGEWRRYLSRAAVRAAERCMTTTAQHSNRVLTILVAYDGVREMVEGIRVLVDRGRRDPEFTITPESILSALATGSLPPVDLLIRTGTDPHNSAGFMMWLTAYTQYVFSPLLWPDFTPLALTAAVREFTSRSRRFGA